ncbi:MAG: ABC transporter ATP-binding protein [Chloroflexi bacterium]|nr:ABC transporter ATP-binding protein [Chloroflexota bacterium]
MIEARGLAKQFGTRTALHSISFQVAEGEIYGLLGRNGAGKTTTVRILACLLRPSAGTARVAGYDISTEAAQVRARVGILTEVPGLYERLNAWEYLDFFGEMYRLPGPVRRARAEELLRLLGLWEVRRQRLRAFSKGMKQKVAIARALLHQPRVLFFDEPTAALDPESAKTVRDYLRYLAEEGRVTVLLCTHNLAEAEQLCRRLSIVRDGRQIAEGTPAELKARIGQRMVLRLRDPRPELLRELAATPGVEGVERLDGRVYFRASAPDQVNPRVVARLVAAGAEVIALETEEVNLEEVYLALVRGLDASGPAESSAAARAGEMVCT